MEERYEVTRFVSSTWAEHTLGLGDLRRGGFGGSILNDIVGRKDSMKKVAEKKVMISLSPSPEPINDIEDILPTILMYNFSTMSSESSHHSSDDV